MAKQNKFKAKSIELAGFNFDSQLEARAFVRLRELFPDSKIDVHYRFQILNSILVETTGVRIPGVAWAIDFKVHRKDSLPLFVEAKGAVLPSFKRQLLSFQRFHPVVVPYLFIVFENDRYRDSVIQAKSLYLPSSQILSVKSMDSLLYVAT